MTRQFAFLLALGLLAASGALVSIAGWILFVRDRRSSHRPSDTAPPEPNNIHRDADAPA
jgi:hypothetical protein